jgi:hypothetical protein
MITETIRAMFDYDPATGYLTWSQNRSNRRRGQRAGCLDPSGYRVLTLLRCHFMEHRVVWQYVHGEEPECILDHINGVRDDNRIENLRLTNDRMNGLNKEEHRAGSQPGTRFNKRDNHWESRIKIKGRKVHLGSYKTKEEASARYMDAVAKITELENQMLAGFFGWVNPRPVGRPRTPQLTNR